MQLLCLCPSCCACCACCPRCSWVSYMELQWRRLLTSRLHAQYFQGMVRILERARCLRVSLFRLSMCPTSCVVPGMLPGCQLLSLLIGTSDSCTCTCTCLALSQPPAHVPCVVLTHFLFSRSNPRYIPSDLLQAELCGPAAHGLTTLKSMHSFCAVHSLLLKSFCVPSPANLCRHTTS